MYNITSKTVEERQLWLCLICTAEMSTILFICGSFMLTAALFNYQWDRIQCCTVFVDPYTIMLAYAIMQAFYSRQMIFRPFIYHGAT